MNADLIPFQGNFKEVIFLSFFLSSFFLAFVWMCAIIFMIANMKPVRTELCVDCFQAIKNARERDRRALLRAVRSVTSFFSLIIMLQVVR